MSAENGLNPKVMYPIPGAVYERGDITHKAPDEMNRHERRLVLRSLRLAPSPKPNGVDDAYHD